VQTVAVTAGYVCHTPRTEFYDHVDAANVDLKAFTEAFYRRTCVGHLQPVLETLEYIRHHTNVWLEITTLLIPNLNDSDDEIDLLTTWIAKQLGPDVPLHFTAFHPDFKMRDRPPTPPATLSRARRIGMENGLRYVYTGNVVDPVGQTTSCHQCGSTIIGRDGHRLTRWRLDEAGNCLRCAAPCAGVFDPAGPGSWGPRRLPIRVGSTDWDR
jgi:pyruvate formate lyase activating enzyme